MKISCNKNNLQRILSLAERTSSKNPTLPVLSALLLRAADNKLVVSSTNLEVGFEASMGVSGEKEGVVAVPSKTILPLLASISDEQITLETHGQILKINSTSSSSSLKTIPAEEFPILPKVKKEGAFTAPAPIIVSAIKRVFGAVATSYTRPELASIYIFSTGPNQPVIFAATDSFRLAEQKTDIHANPFSFLLPQKSAQELIRIFEEAEGEAEMLFNKNQVALQSKSFYFVSRLTEGEFPNYHGIIPTSFSTQVVIDKAQLISAIKAASIFSSRLSDVLLRINPKNGTLEVKASNSDSGEHNSLCRVKANGEDIESTFNYNYLSEALKPIPDQKVFLGFNGSTKPVLVRSTDDVSYFHLVMPMRGM